MVKLPLSNPPLAEKERASRGDLDVVIESGAFSRERQRGGKQSQWIVSSLDTSPPDLLAKGEGGRAW